MPSTIRDMVAQKVAERVARRELEERLPPRSERRALREQAGLSQQELAALVGVSHAAVSRWENTAQTPRGSALERYVDALDELVARQS